MCICVNSFSLQNIYLIKFEKFQPEEPDVCEAWGKRIRPQTKAAN